MDTQGDMFSATDLQDLIELNRLRGCSPSKELNVLESQFSSRFGADSRLAVYGSLAPGRANHHHLSALQGQWISGLTARGELVQQGWGTDLGYPALHWSLSGPPVDVELFISPQLVRHWPRLDEFEGLEYRRILVPLFNSSSVVAVANLYAAEG